MGHDFLFAFWFFLPAGAANVTPIPLIKVPGLRRWQTPIDCGLMFRGKRLLGDHKTWRGLVSGLAAGTFVLWLQVVLFRHFHWATAVSKPLNYTHLSIISLGLLMSFGVIAGDAIESFCKRQLGIASGHTWFPFDQLDYIIGGLLLSSLIVRLSVAQYLWIIIIWFGVHMLASCAGYVLGFKKQPI